MHLVFFLAWDSFWPPRKGAPPQAAQAVQVGRRLRAKKDEQKRRKSSERVSSFIFLSASFTCRRHQPPPQPPSVCVRWQRSVFSLLTGSGSTSSVAPIDKTHRSKGQPALGAAASFRQHCVVQHSHPDTNIYFSTVYVVFFFSSLWLPALVV